MCCHFQKHHVGPYLDVYARVNDDEWSAWITKTLTVSVDSSVASRFTDMDFSPEVQQRLSKIAAGMLAINAGAARTATAPL